MQVKALKCVVDVCIYFNEHGIGKESEEPLERKESKGSEADN